MSPLELAQTGMKPPKPTARLRGFPATPFELGQASMKPYIAPALVTLVWCSDNVAEAHLLEPKQA